MRCRFAIVLMLVALLCEGAVAQDARRDSLMRARGKAIMVDKAGGEDGFRSLCYGNVA